MSFTMVYYHVPEDFDNPEQPNAFGIGKVIEDIKLSDVKRLFPLEGTYHFRFKHVSNKVTIWMDLKDDESRVISFQNRIVMKVTRINWESSAVSSPSKPSNPSSIPFKTQEIQSPPKPTSFNLFEI